MTKNLRYLKPPSVEDLPPAQREALDRVNDRINAARDLEETMAFLFEATRSVSPCDRIGLAFLEEDDRRVVAHHAVASYEPLLLTKGYAEDLQRSSLERVIHEGRPRVINDLEQYLEEHPQSRSTKLLLREGVRSSMTCPMFVDDRIVGLLFRSSRQKHAYDERHVGLHLAMAGRISQAVEKAWRIEQLEAANAAYTEMLGFVSHELKSPLSSIIMDAGVLRDGYLGDLESKQVEKLARMVAKAEYLLNLVRDYLDLARIESGRLELNAVPDVRFAVDVVRAAVDIVRPQLEEKKMRLEEDLDDSVTCACDPDLMRVAAVNLVGNAVKYGFDGGEILLRVAAEGDRLYFSVRNEGPGFPPGMRSKLFRKFSRLDTPELKKRKGTGVGLYTTWRIIELHGGRTQARSEEGRWAEFSIELPLQTASRETTI
jgi:signal transduction histidine kinase